MASYDAFLVPYGVILSDIHQVPRQGELLSSARGRFNMKIPAIHWPRSSCTFCQLGINLAIFFCPCFPKNFFTASIDLHR